MALAFLGPHLPGRTVINHKDGNKSNNNVDNLEWCTPSENTKHSIYELKKVGQVDNVENGIKVWNSQIEAYGIDPTSINHVLKGKQSHTRGLVFKYLE